jgi:hypothetical protein
MAKSLSFNFTDTPTASPATFSFSHPINYADDWRTDSDEGDELWLTNLTAPTDKPERIRYGQTTIKDVYSNTSIDKSFYAPSRRGSKILAQLTDVMTVLDSADATYEVDLPISGNIVLNVPSNALVTETVVLAFLQRLYGTLFETDDTGATKLKAQIRGALKPSDL